MRDDNHDQGIQDEVIGAVNDFYRWAILKSYCTGDRNYF